MLDLPGGIALIGGNAIHQVSLSLPKNCKVRVKLYVPNQEVGIRNPAFARVISLSDLLEVLQK